VRAKVSDMNLIGMKYEKLGIMGKEGTSSSSSSSSLEKPAPAATRLATDLCIPVLVIVGDLDTAYILAASDFVQNARIAKKDCHERHGNPANLTRIC
jgi:hypothetical protein